MHLLVEVDTAEPPQRKVAAAIAHEITLPDWHREGDLSPNFDLHGIAGCSSAEPGEPMLAQVFFAV